MRSLKESFIGAILFIIFFSCLVFVLFLTNLSNSMESSENQISGEITFIGPDIPPKNYTRPPVNKEPKLDPHIECFKELGLNHEDIILTENLLMDLPCEIGGKGNIVVIKEEDCVNIIIDNKVGAKVCSKKKQPSFNLDIDYGTRKLDLGHSDIKIKRYGMPFYILFYAVLIMIIILYRQITIGVHEFNDYKVKRKKKKQPKQRPKIKGNKSIIYLKTPVKYKDKIKDKINKMGEGIKKRKQEYKNVRVKILFEQFNTISKEANNNIIKGDLKRAKENYLDLFNIYSKLVIRVDKDKRIMLDEVMQYLSKNLGSLDKVMTPSKTIQKGVNKKYGKTKDEDHVVGGPKPKLISSEDLDELREQIDKQNYNKARKVFDGIERKYESIKEEVEEDILKEIDLTHKKFASRGAINVDNEDEKHFMNTLTELREQIMKKKKEKLNKGGKGN